jgi:inner membrane protein
LLFAYACLAGLSHILLDYTNNYGVRPFWPFSERWYSGDIVFIVDPIVLVVLTLGLIVPALFSLINEEIGARSGVSPRGRVAATMALIAVVGYWGLRAYEHSLAVAALESRTYNGADAIRVSAYPRVVNPFRWYGVVETPAFFATMDVDSLNASSMTPEVDPGAQMHIRYKPEETPVTLAAKESYLGRVYLSWAQYPLTETEELANDPVANGRAAYAVHFRDLRYDYPGRDMRDTLGAVVLLTRDLQVVEQRMGSIGKKPR